MVIYFFFSEFSVIYKYELSNDGVLTAILVTDIHFIFFLQILCIIQV